MCTYSMIQLKTISKLPLNKHCGMFESSSKFAELSKGKLIMTFRTILWKKVNQLIEKLKREITLSCFVAVSADVGAK